MFMSFETSMIMSLPFNLFLLFIMCSFYSAAILKHNKSLIKMEFYHFFKNFFPSSWNLVLFFFLLVLFNVLSLFPSSFSLTSLPLLTLSSSLILWSGSYLLCLINNYKNCLSHFLPHSSPMSLSILLVWIEILSWICRPIALSIRLAANLTASHLLMFLCSTSAFVFMPLFFFLLLLISLEVSVAFVQAYVYKLLLSLYMEESLNG